MICFITNSDEVLFKAFTITNNLDSFNRTIKVASVMDDVTK